MRCWMEGTYVTLANMSIGPTVPLNGQETGSAFGSGASTGGSVGVAATKVVKPQRPRRKEEANIVMMVFAMVLSCLP